MLSRPYAAATAEQIAHHLRVIGSPVRVLIVEALDRHGELPVAELAALVGVTGDDASQHLRVLRREGVVRRRRDGKRQLYSLADGLALLEIYALVARNLQHSPVAAIDRELL